MNLKPILKTLMLIGFLQIDAEIYLYLAISGPQDAQNIAEALKIPNRQVYHSLKSLRQKQIVAALHGHPARYSASSFEEVLDRFKQLSIEDARRIEQKKQGALAIWRTIITNMEKQSQKESFS